MNSLIATPAAVNSVNWYVPTVSVPFTFGEQDARDNIGCVPENYWSHIDDMKDYCAGFESVAGPTLTTRYFLGGDN